MTPEQYKELEKREGTDYAIVLFKAEETGLLSVKDLHKWNRARKIRLDS